MNIHQKNLENMFGAVWIGENIRQNEVDTFVVRIKPFANAKAKWVAAAHIIGLIALNIIALVAFVVLSIMREDLKHRLKSQEDSTPAESTPAESTPAESTEVESTEVESPTVESPTVESPPQTPDGSPVASPQPSPPSSPRQKGAPLNTPITPTAIKWPEQLAPYKHLSGEIDLNFLQALEAFIINKKEKEFYLPIVACLEKNTLFAYGAFAIQYGISDRKKCKFNLQRMLSFHLFHIVQILSTEHEKNNPGGRFLNKADDKRRRWASTFKYGLENSIMSKGLGPVMEIPSTFLEALKKPVKLVSQQAVIGLDSYIQVLKDYKLHSSFQSADTVKAIIEEYTAKNFDITKEITKEVVAAQFSLLRALARTINEEIHRFTHTSPFKDWLKVPKELRSDLWALLNQGIKK